LQSGYDLRQHPSQHIGRRTHLLILQQVNEFAEPTIVAAVSRGLFKRGTQEPAQSTNGFLVFPHKRVVTDKPVSTDRTDSFFAGTNLCQALSTYRKAGNIDQRSAAKAAIGREKSREQSLSDPTNRRDQGSHQSVLLLYNLGLGGPSWVPTTAEDEPPSSG
jgi:hypothetical protein